MGNDNMKEKQMLDLRQKFLGAVAFSAFVGSLALAVPAMAAEAAPPAAAKAHVAKGAVDPVEAQIARLHSQLHITEAQTDKFNAVAQVMRDNRKAHEDLVVEKRLNEDKVSAVEDLRAYAQIAQNHADGVKKLAEAFEGLYASLSDEQKQAADEAFRAHKRRLVQHAAPKAH